MQVQSFRKVGGYSYASTMCIGNLRSGIAALSGYSLRGFTHLKETLEDYFMKYYKEERDFGGALEK